VNIIKVFSVDMGGTIEHKTEWNNSDTETEVLLICSHMHNLTKSWPESRRQERVEGRVDMINLQHLWKCHSKTH
jgi:hypothetical protein